MTCFQQVIIGWLTVLSLASAAAAQAVNDPLSVVKQREVRKLLRGLEDSK
jgi:hypothetical protein